MPSIRILIGLPRKVSGKSAIKGYAGVMNITGSILRVSHDQCDLIVEHIQRERIVFFLGTLYSHFQDLNVELELLEVRYNGRKKNTTFNIIVNQEWKKKIANVHEELSSDDNVVDLPIIGNRSNITICDFVREQFLFLNVPESDISDSDLPADVIRSFKYNIIEDKSCFVFEIATPGFKRQELQLSKNKYSITVKGEKEVRSGKYLVSQLPVCGLFITTIRYPPSCGKIVSTCLTNGLLVITFEKERLKSEVLEITEEID